MKPNNCKKIAVTGGIGSGKTFVLSLLRDKGYPVFSCDEIYRGLLQDVDFLADIETEFEGVVKDGVLQREKLSKIVFQNKEKLNRLNAITHPKIMKELYEEMEQYPISFAEVPLLFESDRVSDFDAVIVVYRERNERVQAVCERDGLSREQVELRIKNQFDYEKIMKDGHTIIYNDGDVKSLKEKVSKALESIL